MQQQFFKQEKAALYAKVEKAAMPILLANANRFHRAMRVCKDDALQEARIILMNLLDSYDYNKSHGNFMRFASVSIRNKMISLINKANSGTRSPSIVVREDGRARLFKLPSGQVSLDDIFVLPTGGDLEDEYIENEEKQQIEDIKERLRASLNNQERLIFELIVDPDDRFQTYIGNIRARVTSKSMGAYLGLSKNSVDWAVHKIRFKFTRIVEREYPERVELAIATGRWPMITASAVTPEPNYEFIAEVIERRRLDPRPISPPRMDVVDEYKREIQRYPWGVVLVLHDPQGCTTVVVEGEINLITGEVVNNSAVKSLLEYVPSYRAAARKFAEMSRTPHCLGEHDSRHPQCSGDPSGETDDHKAPCFYRDRCVAYQYLQREAPGEYVKPKMFVNQETGERRLYQVAIGRHEDFMEKLNNQIVKWGIRGGAATRQSPRDFDMEKTALARKNGKKSAAKVVEAAEVDSTKESARPAAAPLKKKTQTQPSVAKAALAVEDKADETTVVAAPKAEAVEVVGKKGKFEGEMLEQAYKACHHFVASVEKALGAKVAPTPAGAEPGTFYVVDRIRTSGYISLYLKTESKKVPIACAMISTKPSWKLRIAAEPEAFAAVITEESKTQLGLRPVKDGAFRTATETLNGLKVVIAAEAIAKAHKAGTFTAE